MSDEPIRVTVLVTNDKSLMTPVERAVADAVDKHNCGRTFDLNSDRVLHFRRRVEELGLVRSDVVIVILNVDDPHGGPIAETLMPGVNWQPVRDSGEVPFARGLAGREGILHALEFFDEEAAEKLRTWNDVADGVAVVVVDRGVADVFPSD